MREVSKMASSPVTLVTKWIFFWTNKKCIGQKLVLLILLPFIFATAEDKQVFTKPKKTFNKLFATGVEAYHDQTWFLCATSFEDAIKEYKFYKKTVIDCRLQCKKSTTIREVTPEMVEFSVYEKVVESSDCIRRCKKDKFGDRVYPDPRDRIHTTFRRRKPYEYLQFCWFQLDRMKEAASAAYTFYLANPDHEDTISNIRYYKDKAGVLEGDFIDLELRPYKEAYIRGLIAYNDEDWEGVRSNMEVAIVEFYREEERCRADCEDIYEPVVPQEFVSAVADHYLSVLECQSHCEKSLSKVFTEEMDDFVADHYHYLQFAYYRLKNDEKAIEAAATYLMFQPNDETMLRNKAYYIKRGYSERDFKPRKNAVDYLERNQQMERILDFSNFNYLHDESEDLFEEDEVEDEKDKKNPNKHNSNGDWMKPYERIGLKIISHGDQLKGKHRFAADGFVRQEQCSELIALTKSQDVNKNGAKVATIKDAREMLKTKGLEYEVSLRFLLRISETSRHYIMKYYNLTRLFFKHTSVVCWEAEKDRKDAEEQTCIRQEDGSCVEELPSHIGDEEYTGVMFLSDIPAEEGSNIYFMAEDKEVESKIGIKCGRLVVFESSDRHGVNIPYSEERCGLVIKYTTDPTKDEQDYVETIKALQKVDDDMMQSVVDAQSSSLEDLKKRGIKVTKEEKELHGNERVVADGLATDDDCEMLKNLVLEHGAKGSGYEGDKSPHTNKEKFVGFTLTDAWETGALVGDGYEHLPAKPSFISPHTEHEMFQGLTVYRAAKLANSEKVSYGAVELFLDLSERARLFTERYFNVTKPLYFDFTHLVCRTAMDDTNLDRPDLSHPVHADNCMLKPDGSCPKEFPAYIQRDYSAILYLNDEFEGGNFFFAHKNKTAQVDVHPRCGRLVSFNAGQFHGVKAVVKGTRCALALWFTMNPQFKELAHLQARKILATKKKEREAELTEHSEL